MRVCEIISLDKEQIGVLVSNANKCPVFLLTGAYDFSCSPDDTLRTSSKIQGSEVTIMENLGHFPMSENPMLFKDYLYPVLEKIEQLNN